MAGASTLRPRPPGARLGLAVYSRARATLLPGCPACRGSGVRASPPAARATSFRGLAPMVGPARLAPPGSPAPGGGWKTEKPRGRKKREQDREEWEERQEVGKLREEAGNQKLV